MPSLSSSPPWQIAGHTDDLPVDQLVTRIGNDLFKRRARQAICRTLARDLRSMKGCTRPGGYLAMASGCARFWDLTALARYPWPTPGIPPSRAGWP